MANPQPTSRKNIWGYIKATKKDRVVVGLRNPKFPPKFEAFDIVFFSADYASLGCI